VNAGRRRAPRPVNAKGIWQSSACIARYHDSQAAGGSGLDSMAEAQFATGVVEPNAPPLEQTEKRRLHALFVDAGLQPDQPGVLAEQRRAYQLVELFTAAVAGAGLTAPRLSQLL